MPADLRVTVRFLQPYSHGRGDDGLPEWPPSPLRLFQALVASTMGRVIEPGARDRAAAALRWLERQPAPEIVAPRARQAQPYRTFVPDNIGDRVARAWSAGRDASLSEYRTEKDIQPVRLDGEAVHYLFRAADDLAVHLASLRSAARSITHLGWGIDMVAGDAANDEVGVAGELWIPGKQGGRLLRAPVAGTLAALEHKHAQFLHRLDGGSLRPVAPLTAFAVLPYARATDPCRYPFAAYRLIDPATGERRMYDPARRARDVAAWLRHAIGELSDGWPFGTTEQIVHGHGIDPMAPNARFSYLPLPSITPLRVEGIARALVTAPPGLGPQLDWVRARLAGQELVWRGEPVAVLEPLPDGDAVLARYVAASDRWSTVTPVVLPGHDDGSARKGERMFRRAFLQAGFEPEVIDGIQELEWRKVGFRAGLSHANRYLRPDKLTGPLYHVRVRFSDRLAGPIAIGSGRHRGLGIFAAY